MIYTTTPFVKTRFDRYSEINISKRRARKGSKQLIHGVALEGANYDLSICLLQENI